MPNETIASSSGQIRVPAEAVRRQLDRLLASPTFANARKLSSFLAFAVAAYLDGTEVKESIIGVEVYGREATYNPKTDSIVRAEATRLRSKLREYYETDGKQDQIRIDLPKGTYRVVVEFASEQGMDRTPLSAGPLPERPAAGRRRWALAGAAGLILLIALAVALLEWGHVTPQKHRIALIPSETAGSDAALDSLADHLNNALLQALLNAPEWSVVRTAAGQAGDEPFRLNSSLKRGANGSVRVVLELVRTADGSILWTDTDQRRPWALAETAKDIARAAVAGITEKMSGRKLSLSASYYLQGRKLWGINQETGLEAAVVLYRKAVAADPRSAEAWAGLAGSSLVLANLIPPAESPPHYEEARKAVTKALALDDSCAEAHTVLGRLLRTKDMDFRRSALEYQRAVALDPDRVYAQTEYSDLLAITGALRAAEDAIRAARARLPILPELIFQEGSVNFLARKPDRTEELARELLALDPESAAGRWLLAMSYELRGKWNEAIGELRRGAAIGARFDSRSMCGLAHAYGMIGDRKAAMETTARFFPTEPTYRVPFDLWFCAALTQTSLGDHEKALDYLEKAYTVGDHAIPYLPLEPRLDPLHGNPRYQRLVDTLSRPAHTSSPGK